MKALALCLFSTLGACVADDPSLLAAQAELQAHRPVLIQPGADQILLAVTEDNFAVYQEGQSVFATKLTPGAERTFVATIPGTNVAQVLQVGKVVFVWTDPQVNRPGLGVSPLVLWTAEGGAALISAQSSVGLVATAASSDSKQIVFTTNVSDDNARGDLVHAATNDPLHPTTLVANIPMTFPSGPCRPLANFGRDRGHEFPVAAYCAGTDTTATLSKWQGGNRTDLIANIATPMPFVLESDADANTFLVNLANNSVATVTTRGEIAIVDTAARSPVGFIGDHGTVGYVALGAPPQLRLAYEDEAPETVSSVRRLYLDTYNRSGYSKPRTVSSDGELVLFASIAAPTGLTDMNLLELKTGNTIPLDTTASSTAFSEIFTSDGSHAFYATDLSGFVGTLVTGDRTGVTHTVAEGVWDALAAWGSDVSFNTNPVIDFSSSRSFLLATGDLFVADTHHPDAAPRLVATQANLFYLPSDDRKELVFASASEPAGPGLYLARAR